MEHKTHQMQLTSLYCKWGNYTEEQYNSKFRQEVERLIIQLHRENPEGLTDEELGEKLENLLGRKLDTDYYRPRRCDLSKKRMGKKGNLLRPSFLYDSGENKRNKHDRLMIVWRLSPENLGSYMEEK